MANLLLAVSLKFWQTLRATVLSSYSTFSESLLLDMRFSECQHWPEKQRPTLLFPALYVHVITCSQFNNLTAIYTIQGIDFLYNAQHDCPLAKCTASGKQPLMQERVESGLVKTYIEHQSLERFVINTHAFHNAHLLRATLPRSLVAPILLHLDRQAKHIEIAGSLRATQEAKRTATKVRAALKKQEVVNSADRPGPSKRTRLEMEEADLGGAIMDANISFPLVLISAT